MTLRTRLLALTLAALVPAVVFSIAVVVLLHRNERTALDHGLLDTARALSLAIDRELDASITGLRVLALSRSLVRNDLENFDRQVREARTTRPKWENIALVDPVSARHVINTLTPYGSPLPAVRNPALVEMAVRTRAPVVSGLVSGSLVAGPLVAVLVPVVRDQQVPYVLIAELRPQAIGAILAEQALPADWLGTIVDGNDRIIARTRGTETFVGGPPSASLVDNLRLIADEGTFETRTLEGERVRTAVRRSALSGWAVALGAPAHAVERTLVRSLGTVAGAGLLGLLLGTGFALASSRRIERAVTTLVEGARELGSGGVPRLAPLPMAELDEVGRALTAAADERRRTEAALDAARHEAEVANRAKDEFLAVLSHELRTPLQAILGWARMLRTGQLDAPTTARALEVIDRSVQSELRLVDEILDISRIVSGQMRLDVAPVALDRVVDAALDTVRPAIEAKGIHLATALDRRLPAVSGDAERLQQVVWNLLANAVKFTPAGGTIRVTLAQAEGTVRVVVSDTGHGIAAELLPRVFDRFWQADTSRTRVHGGLGIGLALVRHLVELHGGSVSAESAGEGKGATLTVELPLPNP